MIGPIKRALFEYSAAWGIYQRDHVRGVATDVDRDAVDKLYHRLINLIDSIEVSDDLVDPRDIFNHLKEFNSPGKIQIVAPGPNGIRHYCELNPDYLTIVVNKAVELPIKKDIWIWPTTNSPRQLTGSRMESRIMQISLVYKRSGFPAHSRKRDGLSMLDR